MPPFQEGYFVAKLDDAEFWVKTDGNGKQLQVTQNGKDATYFKIQPNGTDHPGVEQDRIWDEKGNLHVAAKRPVQDDEPVIAHKKEDDEHWNYEWRVFDGNHASTSGTIRAVWQLDQVWTLTGPHGQPESNVELSKIQHPVPWYQTFEFRKNKPN